MKITLKNFRCYKDETTIDITQGVTLIKGQSGSGKTTIIEAIIYTLYGKLRKPYTIGETKCSVTLQITDTFQIYRQSGPGRVRLTIGGARHDGTEAQAAINNVYGSHDFFLASSYLKQGGRSPLFSGSNVEKMALIRNLSFRDDRVEEIQRKLKDTVRSLEEDAKNFGFDRDAKKRVLETFKNEYEALKEFKSKNLGVDFGVLNIDELNERAVKEGEFIKTMREELEYTIKYETMIETLSSKVGDSVDITGIEKDINNIDSKIQEHKKTINSIKEANAQKKAEERFMLLKRKKSDILQNLLDEKTKLLEKLGIENADGTSETLKRLTGNIEKNKEIQTILNSLNINDVKDIREKLIKYNAKSESLEQDITVINESLKNIKWNKKQNETLTCPKCSSSLTMKDDKLAVLEENFKPDIRDVAKENASQSMLNNVTKEKNKIDQHQDKFKDSQSTINRMRRELNKYRTGEENQIPHLKSLIKLEDKIKTTAKNLEELKSETVDSVVNVGGIGDESKIFEKIEQLEKSRREKQRIVDKEKDEEKTRAQLQSAKNELGTKESNSIKQSIDEKEQTKQRLELLSNMASNHGKNQELVTSYKKADEKYKISEKKLTTAVKLFEKAKQVEITVLEETVRSLNLEMDKYLTILFPDDPISVTFKTTKNLKSKKDERLVCSLAIFYKNQQYDDVNQLSGGEADRISLAKTLAMNNISGSDYIFLDESLNALHATLKVSVVDLLKDFCRDDKTCIVISHEGVEGAYHNVLDLDKKLSIK